MQTTMDVSGIIIETERLILRPLQPDDLADFYAYASVPGVGEMAGWKHHESMEESEALLTAMTARKDIFAVVHKADQKMIGTLGMHPVDDTDAELFPDLRMREVGFVLSKAYWGQGLMPEAVQAVIGYGFQTLGFEALICCHFPENRQSRRVIEKCGFRYFRKGRFTAHGLQKTFDDLHYIRKREEAEGNG